ncbi:hypothetical protein [Sphingomonas sp. UYAg733]
MRVSTLAGENARATDQDGRTVVIETGSEAIQDYGWGTIFAVASEKFDTGDIVPDSDPQRVIVTHENCRDV